MNYLIVCRSEGKHFIVLTPDNAIRAFKSKEELMEAFKPYSEAWTAGLERSSSALIGMMNMQPVAIQAPEKAEDLLPFIQDSKVFTIAGGALGRGYNGVLVTEDILKFEQFDIWKETMIAGGIMPADTKQTDLP